MKPLICDLCGGNEVVKDGSLFVCQYCGTKYTVETAREMMFGDGPVEVSGKVTIDRTSDLDAALANARRAKAKEDWEESAKYYDMAERIDPTNIEAIFYSSYGKAKISLIDADIFKRKQAFKVLTNCVSIIDDNWDPDDAEPESLIQISRDIIEMSSSSYVFNSTKSSSGITVESDKNQTISLYETLNLAFIDSMEQIIKKDDILLCHKLIADHYGALARVNKEKGWSQNFGFQEDWRARSEAKDHYVKSQISSNPEHKKDLESVFWSENEEDRAKFNSAIKSNKAFEEKLARLKGQIQGLRIGLGVGDRKAELKSEIEAVESALSNNRRIINRIKRSRDSFVLINWECEVE